MQGQAENMASRLRRSALLEVQQTTRFCFAGSSGPTEGGSEASASGQDFSSSSLAHSCQGCPGLLAPKLQSPEGQGGHSRVDRKPGPFKDPCRRITLAAARHRQGEGGTRGGGRTTELPQTSRWDRLADDGVELRRSLRAGDRAHVGERCLLLHVL